MKKINVKVFDLMSRTNEARYIEWHETCKCKCRLVQVFVTINKNGMKIKADKDAQN